MNSRLGVISLSLLICILIAITPVFALIGTETRLSYPADPTCTDIMPSGDSAWVVWQQECGAGDTIIAYNYVTGVQAAIPKTHARATVPFIRGNRVVYLEDDGFGTLSYVYYADLDSLPPVPHLVTADPQDRYHPVVDGGNIAWQEFDPVFFTSDILMFNITSSTTYLLTPDDGLFDQMSPSIFGKKVVWLDTRTGDQQVSYNDTSDWSQHDILPLTPGLPVYQPIIYGDSVVCHDDNNEIYLSDLFSHTQKTFNGIPKRAPSLVPPHIVWKESSDGGAHWNIALYNITTTITDSVTTTGTVSTNPDDPVVITPDSRIIWADTRGGGRIYMFSNGISTTCPAVSYSTDVTEGNAPLTVQFTDTSTSSPTHWYWDFGDGTTSTIQNAAHTFSTSGVFPVNLTVGTPYCRNKTSGTLVKTISVGVPAVDFSANVTEGLTPLPVAFSGSGTNSPLSWAWEFGDGGTNTARDTVHSYTTPGTYSVRLTAANAVGLGSRTRTSYIAALNGTTATASLPVTGISVTGTPVNLSFDKGTAPSYVLSGDAKTLTTYPPALSGWQNITFLASDPAGFSENPSAIWGYVSTVVLKTQDLTPAAFSNRVGNNLPMNLLVRSASYPPAGSLTTRIWEGTSPVDEPLFRQVRHLSGYSSHDAAYTVTLSCSGISQPSSMNLNLSAGSGWVTGSSDIASERAKVFVIADGYTSQGDFTGVVLPVSFMGNDTVNQIEYFSAEVPAQYSYLSKFALVKLSGSGNPLQLITLTVASHVSSASPSGSSYSGGSGSDSDYGTAGGSGQGTGSAGVKGDQSPPGQQEPAGSDPVVTGTVYANAEGIVTQATTLVSTDNKATLNLPEGVIARDANGNPLVSLTMTSSPAGMQGGSPATGFQFEGVAYNLGPDGATFSPSISLTYTVPQASWGKDYTVRAYDQKTGSWQDLPTTFDPATGTVTAQVSHFCCFGLFSKVPGTPPVRTPVPVQPAMADSPATQAPPSTAVSIFSSMMVWAGNLLVNNGAIVTATALVLAGIGGVWFLKSRR